MSLQIHASVEFDIAEKAHLVEVHMITEQGTRRTVRPMTRIAEADYTPGTCRAAVLASIRRVLETSPAVEPPEAA